MSHNSVKTENNCGNQQDRCKERGSLKHETSRQHPYLHQDRRNSEQITPTSTPTSVVQLPLFQVSKTGHKSMHATTGLGNEICMAGKLNLETMIFNSWLPIEK